MVNVSILQHARTYNCVSQYEFVTVFAVRGLCVSMVWSHTLLQALCSSSRRHRGPDVRCVERTLPRSCGFSHMRLTSYLTRNISVRFSLFIMFIDQCRTFDRIMWFMRNATFMYVLHTVIRLLIALLLNNFTICVMLKQFAFHISLTQEYAATYIGCILRPSFSSPALFTPAISSVN